jgi:hypothetical protein
LGGTAGIFQNVPRNFGQKVDNMALKFWAIPSEFSVAPYHHSVDGNGQLQEVAGGGDARDEQRALGAYNRSPVCST